MTASSSYDVFLSHSSKDKGIVRPLAERLKADGLRVWFDEWEIRPGDSIPAKIEDGLERSRVLVLCMSANALGSEWSQLESYTFRFRDPQNKERRFIPLRLDGTPIKGSLAQFLYINWLPANREQGYAELLEACRPTGTLASSQALKPDKIAKPNYGNSQNHDLQIRINPTRHGRRQLAQIRLLNAGPRPILVDAWFVRWTDESMSVTARCESGALPVRLQDHERAELLVDISSHPVDQLVGLGVVDAERRYWDADGEQLRLFTHVAKLHQLPKIETSTNEPAEPSDVSIMVIVSESSHGGSKRLEVRFKNLGPHSVEPRAACVEWQYEPAREMPREPDGPRVAESGGSISLRLDGGSRILAEGDTAVFSLDSRDPIAPAIISVLADDVPDGHLSVNVACSRWGWTASAEEVPGAIRKFARAVLQSIQ